MAATTMIHTCYFCNSELTPDIDNIATYNNWFSCSKCDPIIYEVRHPSWKSPFILNVINNKIYAFIAIDKYRICNRITYGTLIQSLETMKGICTMDYNIDILSYTIDQLKEKIKTWILIS